MATPTLNRDTILKAVHSWPLSEQMALAQAILQRAAEELATEPQRPSWRDMVGLASNGQEPPTDEQIAEWLDERRTHKYGG
jgi:hypothetical protein